MKRFALLIATLGFFSACNSSDSIITCDRYDEWLASCSNCSMTLSCEDNYDSLAPDVQIDLDDCADYTLMDNLYVCGDWTGDVQYCVDLGYQYLGISCDDYWCGDGICDHGEDEFNCSTDCTGGPYCGDGSCDIDEDPVGCPLDCAYIVCDDYQTWLESCFDNCTAADSCDAEYGVLDDVTAAAVWDCAEFLADEATEGLCLENTNGECDIMLEEELGSYGDCTY